MTNDESVSAPAASGAASQTAPEGSGKKHIVRAGAHSWASDKGPDGDPQEHRNQVEPWLAALLQAEHLNLLIGGGLTTAIAKQANAPEVGMDPEGFACARSDGVRKAAEDGAKRSGRGTPNLEDEIRAARELIAGLQILARASSGGQDDNLPSAAAKQLLDDWTKALDARLKKFLGAVLKTEQGIRDVLLAATSDSDRIRRLLGSFLLTFASRTATRERLHIFTTNYDRVIEYGCDLLGLRVLDRFVGRLNPVFRASRLGVDMHYNPPGIRGEPRYLEGVVRLSKLHGSIDWRQEPEGNGNARIVRALVSFSAREDHPDLPKDAMNGLLIYPNPAKDVETLEYPYAELFRDFAAAVCQPNAVLVTYGYGFGDDHINRILRDMLTIPSTHVAILSYDDAAGRIPRFCEGVGRDEQITLLVGPHFGNLSTLVEHYLPKPAIDRTTWRMVDLLNRRTPRGGGDRADGGEDDTLRGDR
jgi:hypothetical protein